MDQKYEFEAPQYVDFNNLAENDNEVDEFFNVDMESGEAWVTANNTLGESVSTSYEGGAPTRGTIEVHAHEPEPMSMDDNHVRPSETVEVPKQPTRAPSNMVTSWSGPVIRILGKGINPTKAAQQRTRKPIQGKVGRANILSTVQASLANPRNTTKHQHGTPRRLLTGNTRTRGCSTPKRLGTNLFEPRLAVSRPRTQIQKSLNTPTASKFRRKSKSPVSIPFPKTPAVMQRYKSRQLGDLGQVDDVAQQPEQRLMKKENNSQTRFRSQAEQIKLYQSSTPLRFRSRPKYSKSVPVARHYSAPAYGARARPRTTVQGPVPSSKTTVVQTIRNDSKFNLQETKNVVKPTITIPAPFKFTTEIRAEERAKFEVLIREKETAVKEKQRLEDEEKAKEENEELIKARRALVHKAQPIHCPKPLIIKKSDKRPTNPLTPQFQRSALLRKNKWGDN